MDERTPSPAAPEPMMPDATHDTMATHQGWYAAMAAEWHHHRPGMLVDVDAALSRRRPEGRQ